MKIVPLISDCEYEAVVSLCKHEVNKVAAEKRFVSFHTQKNQIKSAMAKLGVTTQIGLIKEFIRLCLEAKVNPHDIRQMISVALLVIYTCTCTHFDTYRRFRSQNRRRFEIETIV